MNVSKTWDAFWFRDAGPYGLIAARVVVALTALWIVLSRPMLPDVVRWPSAFWNGIPAVMRVRYLIVPFPFPIEMALYVGLIAALVLVVAGIAVRPAALASGLLLYHFAPMEDIFASRGGPFFRGFTVPMLALLVIAFARRARVDDGPSPEHRWPVALIQLLYALTYLLSGISKLRLTGLEWATANTFESIVMSMMIPDSVPPWASAFVGRPLLDWLGAFAGIAMDFLFIGALFSRRAARIIVPAAFLAHLTIVPTLGVVFLSTPMLLLFVNWDWIASRGLLEFPATHQARS
jgi:hypothetical protein